MDIYFEQNITLESPSKRKRFFFLQMKKKYIMKDNRRSLKYALYIQSANLPLPSGPKLLEPLDLYFRVCGRLAASDKSGDERRPPQLSLSSCRNFAFHKHTRCTSFSQPRGQLDCVFFLSAFSEQQSF